jgi:LysR family cys regulon transcriptional activator
MNLHQFRFCQGGGAPQPQPERSGQGPCITSQPGVSKPSSSWKKSWALEIFARHGKRLKRVTVARVSTC